MATFVLVPGATLGSWCWKRVIPLLRNLGHEVYPITLTGLAERAHLASAAVTMQTHVQDIVSLIEVEDLSDVILVAHSLGGDPATGAADRISQRIAQLVYFDSGFSENGQSGFSDSSPEHEAWVRGRVIETERGPLFQAPDSRDFGLSDEADVEWANSKMSPHPFNAWSWADPIHFLHEQELARIPKSYIDCIGDQPPGQAQHPDIEGTHYYEIPYGHMGMINAPEVVANLFHSIAVQPLAEKA